MVLVGRDIKMDTGTILFSGPNEALSEGAGSFGDVRRACFKIHDCVGTGEGEIRDRW